MSKEMQLLKSKMEFYKRLINELYNSYKYDKIIAQYENELLDIYKKVQELKGKEE